MSAICLFSAGSWLANLSRALAASALAHYLNKTEDADERWDFTEELVWLEAAEWLDNKCLNSCIAMSTFMRTLISSTECEASSLLLTSVFALFRKSLNSCDFSSYARSNLTR